jgi:hypothetical protein
MDKGIAVIIALLSLLYFFALVWTCANGLAIVLKYDRQIHRDYPLPPPVDYM